MANFDLTHALTVLNNQGVIAYPTESVFGLGCDPDCNRAINNILHIKKRSANKGLILIAANINQLRDYADFNALNKQQLTAIQDTWPGPFTWIIPSHKKCNKLLSGDFNSIAVRVSAHPTVQELCRQFGKPIISTSANLSKQPPCTNSLQVKTMFANQPLVEEVVDAPVSGLIAPTKIYDALTGKRLR